VKWKIERPFDGQLCHEDAYEKLLKLDNPSSSYGKKILVFFYAPQCTSTAATVTTNTAANTINYLPL